MTKFSAIRQSSNRPSKLAPEKRDLTKFINGGDGYGIDQATKLIPDDIRELAESLLKIYLDSNKAGQEAILLGINAGKPQSKSLMSPWTTTAMIILLAACVLFSIIVAYNYGSYFEKESQNTALNFIFSILPTAIFSFLAGRKTKGD
jgi:hypothetical protein